MLYTKELLGKYVDFFHDGTLVDIEHLSQEREIRMTMSSAEIDPEEDIKDPIEYSLSSGIPVIKGILILKKVEEIRLRGEDFFQALKMPYPNLEGDILDFEINGNVIVINTSWECDPPTKYGGDDFVTMQITAEEITWQSLPS